MGAMILDGWNVFGYDSHVKKEYDNRQLTLVASKYLSHDWELYIDPIAAYDSRFKIFKDGDLIDSQPRASQCMRIADDAEEYGV